jgi:hypothetical protein
MRTLKGKALLLLLLLVAWGAIFALRRPAEPPGSPAGEAERARAARTPTAQPGGLPALKVELLKIPRPPYPAEVQSIFGAPPPPPPVRSAAEAARAAAAAAAPPATPPDPFQEEAKQLRYVGFLQSDGTTLAFIIRGQELHTVPVGGAVGGQFRVREVREDAVLLASPSGDRQLRLPLSAEAGGGPRR